MPFQTMLSLPSQYVTEEVLTVELAENAEDNTVEALPFLPTDEMEDWVYGATVETPGGPPATGVNLDLQPGFTAQWNAAQSRLIRVTLEGADLAEHAITNVPEALDTVQMIVTVDDDVRVATALQTQDGETLDFEIDDIIQVKGGQVVRVAVMGAGKNEPSDWIAENGAPLNLFPA